jgi:hypothetical protein
VHGHHHRAGRQGGANHPALDLHRLVDLDADLDVRHVVPVQHDVAALAAGAAPAHVAVHLAQQPAPHIRELRPGRPRGDHRRGSFGHRDHGDFRLHGGEF